jgi:adenylate cyclase
MSPGPTERKLAAILSADVVGYSRLMAEDEAGTIQTLTDYRSLITNLVTDHHGRVVDSPGDNLLAEFPNALDAVQCAVEVQGVLRVRNQSLPEQRRMLFRIGVHLGDITAEGGRVYGDGVNIAARLEGLADPGGTCVSSQVLDQVRRKLELDFDDLGEQPVKNIPDPVHAYRLRERATEAPPQHERRAPRAIVVSIVAALAVVAIALAVYTTITGRSPVRARAPLTSIAVLPFDDMSPGSDQAWLANGMAEELIEALSRIEALRVMARTSAFALRGQNIETVGKKLKVGSVVEGSVRRSGNELRITAQLIRVADGSHLWSARYDRELADVFATQSEIAREVAEAVRSELGIEDEWVSLIGQRYAPSDFRAYELVRKAADHRASMTEEGIRESTDYALQALEIDPDYAEAHASLGWNHLSLWIYGYDRSDEQKPTARAAANRALELDDTNGTAHQLLAYLSMMEWRFEDAERRLERALEANPEDSGLRVQYAHVLAETGRLEAALVQAQRAAARDPLYANHHQQLGTMYLLARQYEAAIESLERALELNPQAPIAPDLLSSAYHWSGNDAEALEVSVRRLPEEVEAALRRVYDAGGYEGMVRAAAEALVAQSGRPCTDDPARGAGMYALIGEADQMFACIEETLERRAAYGLFLKDAPHWDPYRGDPRFTALLRRMGLEE